MSSTHPTPLTSASGTIQEKTNKPDNQRFLVGLLITFGIIAGLVGGQIWTTQTTSTDPKIPGRPLSNSQMHLHTLTIGNTSNTLYLGTHFGLFTSNNGGRTWPQARGVLNTLMITVISVNPADPSSLAVIGVPSVSKAEKGGLYFSSDGGKTWSLHIPNNLPGSAFPFTVHAGSAGPEHFYAFYLYAGWFETRDMGWHWRPITGSPLSDMQSPSLLTFPHEPDHLLLGGDQGLFESKDAGQHWKHLATINGNVQILTSSQTQPIRIFCQTDQGLFTWENGNNAPALLSSPTTQPFSRLISNSNGTILYGLSGQALWSSEDAGQHWQKRQQFDRGDLIALQIDPQNSSRLYAGFFLPPKVILSQDSGTSWQTITSQ